MAPPEETDLAVVGAGILGLAVARELSETERALHVRNAPSPAATSSLAIARLIADRAEPGLP